MANEKRLIDANALLAELDKFANPMPNKSGYDFLSGVASVITEVESAPTVDAVEVVHGHCDWCKPGEEHCGTCMKFFDYYGDGGSDSCSSEYRSVKCAYYIPVGYCPNCGTRMDGGAD